MRVIGVHIGRDASTTLHAMIFEYELPILVAIHGEEAVMESGHEDEIEVTEMTATQAYYALLRKYRQHEDAVRGAYADARSLARQSGLRFDPADSLDAKGKGSQQIDHRKLAMEAAKTLAIAHGRMAA